MYERSRHRAPLLTPPQLYQTAMIMISTGRGASGVILAPGTDIFRAPRSGRWAPDRAPREVPSAAFQRLETPLRRLARVEAGAELLQLGEHLGELGLHPLGLAVVRAHALHEPARDRRRHHAEQRDPGHHQRP